MTSGKVPAKAFAVFAVALMMLSVLAIVSSDTEINGYTGDTYSVEYLPGVVDVDDRYNYVSASKVTIQYYGIPVAEYNPQFWADNINDLNGEVTPTGITNWYQIKGYSEQNTTVFAGWYVSDNNGNIDYSRLIEPGDDLREYYSGETTIKLVANWVKVTSIMYISGYYSGPDPEFSYNSNGDDPVIKYQRILLVKGDVSFQRGGVLGKCNYDIGNCTIRSEPGENKKLDLFIHSRDVGLIHYESIPFEFNGPVIIDNVKLVGHGSTTSQDVNGIYASGYDLIIGTGITYEGNVQVYGGTYDGSWGGGDNNTDVRIFSGTYSNIIGGSANNQSRNIDETYVCIAGSTSVVESVIGGSIGYSDDSSQNSVKSVVGETNIIVVSGNIDSNGYNQNNSELIDGDFSTVIGGSRYGYVGTSNVEISGDAVVFSVQGGGRQATTKTDTTNVTISGKATIIHMVCGSVTDGNKTAGYYPVGTSNILIKDYPTIGDVYGGGWDIWEKTIGPSTQTTNITIDGCNTIKGVYGGGFRGDVGSSGTDSVNIEINGGNIDTVYGGGRGGPDPVRRVSDGKEGDGASDINGSARVNGNINININGGNIGSIYGGGCGAQGSEGADDDCAAVYGNISITVAGNVAGSVNVSDSIYGAGRGVESSKSIASVSGDVIEINITNAVTGNVFGGGMLASTETDDILIQLNSGVTINGDVHGGGLGKSSDSIGAEMIVYSDRTVLVNGATVQGNVYGGSRLGGDGSLSGAVTVDKESRILIISGTVMQGIYGGGFQSTSYINAFVLIGTPAIEHAFREYGLLPNMTTSDSIGLRINSIYGGGSLDPSSFNKSGEGGGHVDVFTQPLVMGNAHIEIGSYATDLGSIHFPGYRPSQPGEPSNAVKISIYGDIIGAGNFSDVRSTKEIYIHGYEQNNVYNIKSIQRADEVIIEQSDIAVDGSVDAQSSQLTKLLSINRVGTLTLDRSNIDLYHETMNIDEYRSLVDGNPAGRGDCLVLNGEVFGNRVVLHDGVMFDIRGSGDDKGTVEGYTLLTRPGGDMYYGAFAVSYGVASGVSETGFMVGDGTEEASLLISSSSGAYIWYIAGYYTLNEQLNFSETGSLNAVVNFAFPKMSSESHFEYMGGYVDPVVQDGVVITNEGSDYVNFTNTLGQSPTGNDLTEMVGSRMIFGMTLSETIGSVTKEAAVALHTFNTYTKQFERQFGTGSSYNPVVSQGNQITLNATLLSSDYYKQGYGTSGSLGTVMIHLAEVLDNGVPVNMIDLRVSIYVEPVKEGDNVIDLFVTVMSSGSGTSRGRGYIDLPSTALPMFYYFDRISDHESVSKLTMWSDMTHLGINGWNSIVYSDVGKLLTIKDDKGVLNSQTYLGQGSGVRTSTLAFDYEGDKEASFTITLVDRQSQDGKVNTTYNVYVTVKPVSNIELDIAFRPLSSDSWKYLSVVSGDGSSSGNAYTLQWGDSKSVDAMMTLPYGTVLSTDCAWFVLDLTALGGTQSTPKYMTYQEAFEAMLDFSVSVEGSDESFNYKDNLYGWFINEDLKTKYRMSSPAKENMTLHAGCAIEVRFHGEGVTVSPTTIYVSPGYQLSRGYNNLSSTDSDKISIYNGDKRDGFHLHEFDDVLSWATKTDSGWSLYSFDTPIYDDLDLYLPWDPNEYSITVTVDPNEYTGDLHISVDGFEIELENGTVTIAYTQGVVLDMYVEGGDGTEYPYRITSALLSYGDNEVSVGQTGSHSISFDMPNIGTHGTNAELKLSVLKGYTITVEIYDGKGSVLPETGLNVIVDGTSKSITSSIASVMFTKEGTGNLGDVIVDFSIDGNYRWAVWASTDGVSYSDPSGRNTDSYTISDMQSDVHLKVAVYRYVQIESIGQGIGSVNVSWEGANETVNTGSTVYEGDSLIIVPNENFTLPMKNSSGVVQVGNTFTFTVTGKSDVVLGDLTEVEKAMTITVVLKDGDDTLDGISGTLTLTISGPGGDVSYDISWMGATVDIKYNTPSSGLVKGHIDGFNDVQGTVSWDGLTLEFQIIHYTIQYVGPGGETLTGSHGVTDWTVAVGPVAPSYGDDGQFTAVAVSDSDSGTYQVWLQDDRTLVRTIGVGLFSMSQTLTLYAIPPLEGGGADTNETIVVAVESNHVNGWHSVSLEADGVYTVVLGEDTIMIDLESGAEGEDGVVTITGYPEGKYVGTISFILGDVTLVLKVVPGASGSGSGQGALT